MLHREYSLDNLDKLTILYVEDDIGTRENLLFYLQNSYKKVFTAADGAEGLELFKKEPSIDLIISDIFMPKMDGLMMMREIKKLHEYTPFLLLTAYSNQEYMLEAIELGALSYLVKPIDVKLLFQKIELAYTTIYEQKTLDMLVKKMSSVASLDMQEFITVFDKTLKTFSSKGLFLLADNYQYDFNHKNIIKDAQVIKLNHQEIEILEYLIEHQNSVVTYETLMQFTSSENQSVELLRTVIKSIRKKTDKTLISNLSGVGYKINV